MKYTTRERAAVGYPENLLSPGEQIIMHKHTHFKMLIAPVLIGIVLLTAGIWLGILSRDAESPWNWVLLIGIVVVGGGLLVWLTITPFARWRTTHFVVTNDRLVVREGIIKRSGIDIPMGRINSVNFEHGLIDRIFGCGTLIVESASGNPLKFEDVPDVEEIQKWINRQLNDNPYDDFPRENGPHTVPDQGER